MTSVTKIADWAIRVIQDSEELEQHDASDMNSSYSVYTEEPGVPNNDR